MAENSRMSKLSEKEDECIFSWKLFTGWDFMIGNTETAHNRIASVILGFKEALLEEAEKKKDLRNWRIISLRAFVNICVIILLVISAYAVVTVVSRSDDSHKVRSWWRENETTVVVTMITTTFPVFFDMLGFLEHYHPRKQLRLQLARIMLLNLLNLYSFIFAQFSKIEGMSEELSLLKPNLTLNAMMIPNGTLNVSEAMALKTPTCTEDQETPCETCNINLITPIILSNGIKVKATGAPLISIQCTCFGNNLTNIQNKLLRTKRQDENNKNGQKKDSILDTIRLNLQELQNIKNFLKEHPHPVQNTYGTDTPESDSEDYSFYDTSITDDGFDYVTDTSTKFTTVENIATETTTIPSEYFETTFFIDDFDITTNTYTETDYTAYTSDEPSSIYATTEASGAQSDITVIGISTTDITETTTNFNKIDKADNSIIYTTDAALIETSTAYSTIQTESNVNANKNVSGTVSTTNPTLPIEDVTETSSLPVVINAEICPNITFNCTVECGGKYFTQVFFISNCSIRKKVCYTKKCSATDDYVEKNNNITKDLVRIDEHNRKVYNLTTKTRKKLLKLCWETMFGQELVKLTMMDLMVVLLGTLFLDFFRALLVRYLNRCWCWDLEKRFPEYGDFKIAENILHLINNQGMVWMGMFFSPGLVILNVVKLMIMMYLRSWTVMTCNVPHEVVFRVSKSNNFYLALLLTMLFLCVLPVGYVIVWVKPSWHCGPFSEYDKIYYILTINIYKILPNTLNFALEYIASPAIVIPLLVLLILIIYYLTSLTNSLREANNDLKIQLRRERTEERRKMFQLADTRRRAGSSAMENTPFARWKKALPSLPMSKSIDSDDRKTLTEEASEPVKLTKKRGGIFAKIVGMALDKRPDVEVVPEVEAPPVKSNNGDDGTDTDFHETLPRELLKIKDITIVKPDQKKKNSVEFKTEDSKKNKNDDKSLNVKIDKIDDRTEKKAIMEKMIKNYQASKSNAVDEPLKEKVISKKVNEKQASQSSTQSKQSDSIGSIIPVITISTTESDEEVLSKTDKKSKNTNKDKPKCKSETKIRKTPDLKSLRRQSSVESISEHKPHSDKDKQEDGHQYQYSL